MEEVGGMFKNIFLGSNWFTKTWRLLDPARSCDPSTLLSLRSYVNKVQIDEKYEDPDI